MSDRLITIDFTNDPPKLSVGNAGEIGEINAVKIKVIPEKEMTENPNITSYIVKFAIAGGNVNSSSFTPSQDIEISLWGQLTQKMILPLQLIAQNNDASITMKSKVVRLTLDESLQGTNLDVDNNRDSLLAQIGGFATRVTTVENNLANKVDKVTGKGLSTEDYTTAEKTKLSGIESGANNYTLPTSSASTLGGVKVGSGLTITDGVLSVSGGNNIYFCTTDTPLADVESAFASDKYIVLIDDHLSQTSNHFMPLHYVTTSWFVFGCTASLDNNNVYRTLDRSTGVWAEEVSVEMATKYALDTHTNNTVIHVSNNDKQTWNAKLSDAPNDGKEYARKNGAWTEVQGGGADSIYIVHLVMTSATTIGYASGYSYADMRAKISDGKTILFYIDGLGINSLATQYDASWVKCVFMNDVSANTPTVYYLVCYSDHFEFRATEVAKKNALSNYATTSALTEGLSGKANVSHTHNASDVSYDSSTTYASGTVGKEISDIDEDVTTLSGTVSSLSTDKQDKSISLSGISATTVEGALTELDGEISSKADAFSVGSGLTLSGGVLTLNNDSRMYISHVTYDGTTMAFVGTDSYATMKTYRDTYHYNLALYIDTTNDYVPVVEYNTLNFKAMWISKQSLSRPKLNIATITQGSITVAVTELPALTDLNNKQNKVYYQPSEPSAAVDGDLWVDSDDTTTSEIGISDVSGLQSALTTLSSDIVTLSNANNIDTTDEKVVGNYIYMDGATKKIRPIYQKVLRGTTTASGSAFTVPLGVQNLGLILSIGGSITHSTEVMFIGGWLSNQDYDAKICYYNVSSGNFDCYCGSGLAGDKEYNFIVRFTKSSDTPTVIEQ